MRRRDFVKAAVAAPYVITSAALGNASTPPASDRITLGFVGTGGRGGDGLIVDFLQHSDCQCVAVCDTFRDRRDRRAKQIDDQYSKNTAGSYKSVAKIADFRELVARKDIDAVCVATPDHWHVPVMIAAARAGKDVYVEKPLSPSLEQNFLARKVIRETGRVFQYGTQQRGAGHVRFGCELVRNGRIGKLTAIEVVSPSGSPGGSAQAAPVPEGFDYAMWQGPAPERPFAADRCLTPGHWHIYDYSIGFLGGWGAHPLDVMDLGLLNPAVPVEYEGTGLIPTEGLFNTVMNWNVRCRFADGMALTFAAGKEDSTTFTGTEGWVRIRRRGIEAEPASLIAGISAPAKFAVFGVNHTGNFLDAIRKKAAPESPIDAAIRTDLISHLSNIAVRTGRKIKWDPLKETIVGDAEAARLMHRPIRKPWDKLT